MSHSEREQWLRGVIGREVLIDSSDKKGRVVSVSVTSDGYLIGRTKPGYDRGVFMGRVPWRR